VLQRAIVEQLVAQAVPLAHKQVIARNHVGGVVKRGSLVVGLPEEAWGNAQYGLVPATQSMRLAIAEHLVTESRPKSRDW
jgi:hypothetical protein